jgi:EAL domain-containing protein (putative c-di-GMP-specific phosphodiesterase class I)
MLLLALDDELKMGQFVGRVAGKLGIDAEVTTSVSDFRGRFEHRLPDAIVLDLQIGERDGIEQLRFLSDKGYRAPIILMSGLDDRVLEAARQIGEGLGLQIAAVLHKPVRLAELSGILSELQSKGWTPSAEELDSAICAQELTLDLQPIIEAQGTRVLGVEALVRWNHPEQGRIPPDKFIPLAEDNDELIDKLTMWVIREAGRLHHFLTDAGFSVPIAVNVSQKNLRDLRFPDRIQEVLIQLGLTSSAISLELTETTAFGDPLRTLDILSRLRIKGFALAIDDFGTGYSSLKLLRQLPFSTIKVDRSFVADMTRSQDSYSIVKSVIDLAHNMSLSTVAEGVETAEAAAALVELGVDAMQGYYFSRPLSVEPLCAWLRQRNPVSSHQLQQPKTKDTMLLNGRCVAHATAPR